ncbi:hypothetical protein B0T36_13150 [Nocardia donostiensis]|nr:hypothetical protein B0T36_13150 [Nocardia donostiensis]
MMPMMAMMGMIPQMMQAMDQKRKEDDERKEEREEEEAAQQQQQQQVQQAAAQSPPTGVTAPASTDAPPVINANGMVDAQLPNGTTQKVSSTVAEALNRAVNNPNGSDARAAYAGTPGEATPGAPWTAVDASNLRTGDVVQWENRSALVVVTPDGLYTITSGQMVPLDTNNPVDDGRGSYGAFQGFFHPSGVDTATGPTQEAPPEPPAPPTQQRSAPATPPAVPAPPPLEQV